MTENIKDYLKLYLVLETSLLRLPLGDFIIQAVEGGVTAIQLRDKSEAPRDRYETAKSLAALLEGKDVLFIVNNSPDIAIAAGAHGVHLGAEDLPAGEVRKAFPRLITGFSCNDEADCTLAISDKVHYCGVGPVFFTPTKTNLRPVLGVEGTERIAHMLPVPKVAIGGLNGSNIESVKSLLTGGAIDGVAVSSALCQSDAPYDSAVALRKLVNP